MRRNSKDLVRLDELMEPSENNEYVPRQPPGPGPGPGAGAGPATVPQPAPMPPMPMPMMPRREMGNSNWGGYNPNGNSLPRYRQRDTYRSGTNNRYWEGRDTRQFESNIVDDDGYYTSLDDGSPELLEDPEPEPLYVGGKRLMVNLEIS
jgi:hypothetical protein